ncbi:MAG: dephospho-CoA kinase [Bacteroidales bacterium]|nr:dephospho-CoA kinase [Bacteroidales bacterium]
MEKSVMSVGLTGGIGCGKTTVLHVFETLGVPCFIADDEAKLLYNDATFLDLVVQHFGNSILHPDGSLNRQVLAAIVFNDEEELGWLNRLAHPLVLQRFEAWKKAQGDVPYVIFESAILYEAGIDRQMDYVVDVYLEKEERMRRLLFRDNTTREQLETRMAAQMGEEEKRRRADFVVHNYEGNPRREQVLRIHQSLISRQH